MSTSGIESRWRTRWIWKPYLDFTELAENEYLSPRSKAEPTDVEEYLRSLLADGYLDTPGVRGV